MRTITAKISDRFQLRLNKVVEEHGHDDSIPFHAEIWLKDEKKKWTRIGYAYNDGWGGSACIEIAYPFKDIWKESVEPIINEIPWDTHINGKVYHFKYDAPMLCDFMACSALEGEKTYNFKNFS